MSEDGKVLKKQWSPEEISTLIDTFREHRNLWDPKDANYKNKIKKMDSYKKIAQIFETNWLEIERKIKNIISQYQRERRNYKKISAVGQSFTAKWFGYNAMSFMHNRNKPRKGIQIDREYGESESSGEETQTDTKNSSGISSEIEGESEIFEVVEELYSTLPKRDERFSIQKTSASNTSKSVHFQNQFKTSKINTKKKINTNMEQDSEGTQLFHMMKSIYEQRERDEYDVFGEMVAHNIRHLKSEYSKITVQQQITNILFDARIFQFPQSNTQSFTSVPSPSPSSLVNTVADNLAVKTEESIDILHNDPNEDNILK